MKSENLHLGQAQAHGWVMSSLLSLNDTLTSWQRRARERRELAQLDALTRRDLGLGEGDIWREANKYRWQA